MMRSAIIMVGLLTCSCSSGDRIAAECSGTTTERSVGRFSTKPLSKPEKMSLIISDSDKSVNVIGEPDLSCSGCRDFWIGDDTVMWGVGDPNAKFGTGKLNRHTGVLDTSRIQKTVAESLELATVQIGHFDCDLGG